MKGRVLFVDDEPRFLAGLRRRLEERCPEWELGFAHSAQEARRMLAAAEFDAVISDVSMPGETGLELLASLRNSERTRDVPVVILTGADEGDIKRRALELGATDLLGKPVNMEDLIARIRSVLRLKSYQDELRARNEVLDQKVKERTRELEVSRLEIVLRLAKAAEYRDEETGHHVIRVPCYCWALAQELGLARDFADLLFLASPLHDIGKIGIPDAILLKPGKLTPEEWKLMQRHCEIGARILLEDPKGAAPMNGQAAGPTSPRTERDHNPILRMASTIALYHHERWDGKGYPRGLGGEEIPLEARLVALADAYDALCSERPYKPAYSEETAATIIQSEAGSHFDPQVCAAYGARIEEFRDIRQGLADGGPAPDAARRLAAGAAILSAEGPAELLQAVRGM